MVNTDKRIVLPLSKCKYFSISTNSPVNANPKRCIYPDGDKDLFIADLYNCVPHPQVQPDYFPEYAPSVDGICCHSRGNYAN